ncbi:MAG: hypothetical protein LBR26_09650 [Prevotella sp.]|jgi:hypothetical protein|nr:hypothetical protein [Prevotella sp.]
MTFDDITGDGRLWAVRNKSEEDNELYKLFDRWNDVVWLRSFFKANMDDLTSYFKITDVKDAIMDTIEDSESLERMILDLSPYANLDTIFRPLSNYNIGVYLEKDKAKINERRHHASWLRIYAIKLNQGVYIVTGGSIKLTATMQEREHTANELLKMEQARRFLIENGIVDDDGFVDYMKEI